MGGSHAERRRTHSGRTFDGFNMTSINATYSPEDNKLRLYPSARLPRELYERVRAAGFAWAPKQGLFVAPAWTPGREDVALELAGEIGDEDRTLVERAEDRAERFEDYSGKRASEAQREREAVSTIADSIPFGQPILIGHHSERRARKDAERIENGMRKAVNLWETSGYWKARAAGALAHAKHKERPDVRARRIKTLEADQRKRQRQRAEADKLLQLYTDPQTETLPAPGEPGRTLRAAMLRNFGGGLSYEQQREFSDGKLTEAEAVETAIRNQRHSIAYCDRWIAHYDNRLTYERAMLGESGYVEPPKRPTKAVLPLLNYSGAIEYRNPFGRGEIIKAEAHAMTKAELARVSSDYKGTRISADGSHRIRIAYVRLPGASHASAVPVFLTDSKQHPKPGAGPIEGDEAEKVAARIERARETVQRRTEARAKIAAHNKAVVQAAVAGAPPPVLAEAVPPTEDERLRAEADRLQARNESHEAAKTQAAPFDALREALRAGVQVVAAPQLFPTPPDLAARMVDEAALQPGDRVLEPSAGTGVIVRAIREATGGGAVRTAVEIDSRLCGLLRRADECVDIYQRDFLSMQPSDMGPAFDAVIMNPPFKDAADVAHIRHALRFLKPGGRLVAICANGPRQQSALRPLVEQYGGEWEPLPAGKFSESGTEVRTVLLSLTVPAHAQAVATA